MWIYKELEKRLCRCLYILFLTATSFADFCIFSVPPPSLRIVSVPLNKRYIRWLSTTYICRFYILHRKVDSAWASNYTSPKQKLWKLQSCGLQVAFLPKPRNNEVDVSKWNLPIIVSSWATRGLISILLTNA